MSNSHSFQCILIFVDGVISEIRNFSGPASPFYLFRVLIRTHLPCSVQTTLSFPRILDVMHRPEIHQHSKCKQCYGSLKGLFVVSNFSIVLTLYGDITLPFDLCSSFTNSTAFSPNILTLREMPEIRTVQIRATCTGLFKPALTHKAKAI